MTNKKRIRRSHIMSAFQSSAPRPPASLETVHNILGSLVARYREEEVLTAVRQIPGGTERPRPDKKHWKSDLGNFARSACRQWVSERGQTDILDPLSLDRLDP